MLIFGMIKVHSFKIKREFQNICHPVDVEEVFSREKYGGVENTCRKMFLHIVLYCRRLRGGFCLMQRTNAAREERLPK